MNCDEFLPDLETGGVLRRMRARRHSRKCPRCAAVSAMFAAAKEELVHPEPLSPRARALWNRAAEEPMAQPLTPKRWLPISAGLAAAACLVLILLGPALWQKRVPPVALQEGGHTELPVAAATTVAQETTVIEIDAAEELSQLAEAAERLDGELNSLRDQVERLEVRREVAMMLNRYGKW